jgi:UPF0716 family protein affecting phage T7 exclusion
MTRKTRLWIGVTLLIVLGFNYALIGFPLYKKSESISDAAKAIYTKQVKANKVFKGSRDEYLLEVFRREKKAIESGLLVLNCVSVSAFVIIISWIGFGLIGRKDDFQSYGNP